MKFCRQTIRRWRFRTRRPNVVRLASFIKKTFQKLTPLNAPTYSSRVAFKKAKQFILRTSDWEQNLVKGLMRLRNQITFFSMLNLRAVNYYICAPICWFEKNQSLRCPTVASRYYKNRKSYRFCNLWKAIVRETWLGILNYFEPDNDWL